MCEKLMICAILILVCLPVVTTRSGTQDPDAEKIARDFIDKLEADIDFINANFIYREMSIVTEFKGGLPSKVNRSVNLVKYIDGKPHRRLVEYDGVPVENYRFEYQKEVVKIDAKLFKRFSFTFLGQDKIDKTPVWVLSFGPPKNPAKNNGGGEMLDKFSGKIRISKEGLVLMKVDFFLTEEIRIGLPSFAGAKVEMVQGTVRGGLVEGRFIPALVRMEYKYSGRLLGWPVGKHAEAIITCENYERRDQ